MQMKIYCILMKILVNAIFSCDEIGILNIDLNNINLDHANYDEDDLETIIHIRFFVWHSKINLKT